MVTEQDFGASAADAANAEYGYLMTPRAIRERALAVLAHVRANRSSHWSLHEGRLQDVADRVVELTRAAYPDPRKIPYHSRWRHFDVGGVPRVAAFEARIAGHSPAEKLAARFELVITSVLLDAGAGPSWTYREVDPATGQARVYARSEGLAVASYHLFLNGALSASGAPAADAGGLSGLTPEVLANAFQAGPDNPLAGGDGRAALLVRLGKVVGSTPEYFGADAPRLGNLGRFLEQSARARRLPAESVLRAVLGALGPIWEGRQRLAERSLGDVWRHSELGFVPFHKLSQWLTYSLFEPLEAAGISIDGVDALTGLAEYRNGGLFVDSGVLELKQPTCRAEVLAVDSDLVIEWRALTIALLDLLAPEVRKAFGLSASELPLARVLEGGTWRAGRAIALERRADGSPPLTIASDGTVF